MAGRVGEKTLMEFGETLLVHTAAEWREWLALHHAEKKEIWLIYYKKTSGKTGITYEEPAFWPQNRARRRTRNIARPAAGS